MLQHRRAPVGGRVVAEVRVKHTAALERANPRHRHGATALGILFLQPLVAVERLHRLLRVQVEAHQHAKLVAADIRLRLVLVNLVLVPESPALERLVEDVLRIIELERPRAAPTPWVSVKLAADHPRAGFPSVKIITRRVDAGDAFPLANEAEDRVALVVILERQTRGVVEQDRVVLFEIGLVEHRVLVRQVGGERAGLPAQLLHGEVPRNDRAVHKRLTPVKHKDTPRLFRLGRGLGRQCCQHLGLCVIGQRLEAFFSVLPRGLAKRSGGQAKGQKYHRVFFHDYKGSGGRLGQAQPNVEPFVTQPARHGPGQLTGHACRAAPRQALRPGSARQ